MAAKTCWLYGRFVHSWLESVELVADRLFWMQTHRCRCSSIPRTTRTPCLSLWKPYFLPQGGYSGTTSPGLYVPNAESISVNLVFLLSQPSYSIQQFSQRSFHRVATIHLSLQILCGLSTLSREQEEGTSRGAQVFPSGLYLEGC